MYWENIHLKILLFLFLFTIISNNCISQSISDLEKELPDIIISKIENHNNKEKVKILIKESKKYINTSNQLNFQISKLAIAYAEKQNNKEIKGLAYKNLGISYFLLEKYDLALNYYKKSLKLLTNTSNIQEVSNILYNIGYVYYKTGLLKRSIEFFNKSIEAEKELNNIKSMAMTNNRIGQTYFLLGKYDKAIKYYHLSLKALKKTDSKIILARVYNNIGLLYKKMGEFDEALKLYNKALKLYKITDNKFQISKTLNNIGAIYDNNFHQYDKALKYYNNALAIKRKIGNKNSIAVTLNNLGGVAGEMHNYKKALKNYNEAIKIFNGINGEDGLVLSYNNLGSLYLSMKKFDLAKENFFISLELAKKLNSREYISQNYKLLAELFFITKINDKAYCYYKKYDSIKDSIFNINTRNKIAELNAKFYAVEKQEKLNLLEIENTKQREVIRTNRIFFFSSFFIFILTIIIFYYVSANKRLKDVQKNSDLKQKLFRLQMNPHFIFNSLVAIQSYIYKNNMKLAGEYLSKYSKLIRLNLNYSNQNYFLLEKEIEMIKYYIELQLSRFNNNFDYSINVDKEVNTENIKVPPMLIQPFVENSIEHGIKNLSNHRGKININIKFKNDLLYYEIEDNGIGFKMAKDIQSSIYATNYEKHSLAVSITKDRLKLLSKKNHKKSKLKIIHKKNEKGEAQGVLIKICVPYII